MASDSILLTGPDAEISSEALRSGDGTIRLSAFDIELSDGARVSTSISSIDADADVVAGSIELFAHRLSLSSGAQIRSEGLGVAQAGEITIGSESDPVHHVKVKFLIDKQVVHPTVKRGVPFKVEWFCKRIEARLLFELGAFAEFAAEDLLGVLRSALLRLRPADRTAAPYFQPHDPNRRDVSGLPGVTTSSGT